MQFVRQRSIRPSCKGMTIQGQTHPELRLSYYWEEICEKEASHTTNAKWLDLRVDHSNLPEKKPTQHPKGRHPTMSLRHEGQDTTRTWHDLHLLRKEALFAPWSSGIWSPGSICSHKAGLYRSPQGYSTFRLSFINLPPHSMDAPLSWQESTCEQAIEGQWENSRGAKLQL